MDSQDHVDELLGLCSGTFSSVSTGICLPVLVLQVLVSTGIYLPVLILQVSDEIFNMLSTNDLLLSVFVFLPTYS